MKNDFLRKLDAISRVVKILPNKMAIESVNFTKERFQKQNWIGDTTENWKPRKATKESKQRSKRNTLTDTGRLRRSVRKISASPQKIVIGTDVDYAVIHNQGGRYRVNQRVRAHDRKAYKRRGATVKAHSVGAFSRTINVNMPRRQFIGASPYLQRRLIRMAQADINKVL